MADNGMDADDSFENVFKDAKTKGGGNKKLSVERIYQKKTQLEHILLRPDTYIGSVEPKTTENLWVYDGEDVGMVKRKITFVPGLYKIFDEILVNAADNKQRDKNMDCIKIELDAEKNRISIWNNGKGIPVVEHKDEKMFVPSLIFGHLLTSSNYNDEERKVTGGRNGYGAKLCNIFSTKFVVETSCKQYNKCFKQTWTDNMGKASDPKVQPVKGDDFTCITFYPDLSKFKMEVLDKDIIALMSRRAYDIAGCTKGVKVFLNGKRLAVKSFKDYVELYLKNKEDERGDPLKVVHEVANDRWEIAMTMSDQGFQQISFVNSIATTNGGTHVNYVTDQLTGKIAEFIKKKNKSGKDVRPHQIKSHLWVFVNCLIENPTFDSQTKENMTLQVKNFGSKCQPTEKFINSIMKCGVVDAIMSWVRFKAQTELDKKCSGKKTSKLKGIPKLEDANDAGTRNSIDCTLILTEGDSAKSLAVSGLGVIGRDKFGVFPLKGKMLNVREASHKQILENAEINNIIKIMGLQYKKKYETVDDLKTLRYGRLMIMTDQDQDGSHIKGLLINFIHHNWPSLLRLPFLEEFITPIVKATKNNNEKSFFSLPEFEEWKKETANWHSWKIKYYKGLGTSTTKEAKEYFSDMLRHRIKFHYTGNEDDHAIQLAFSKKMVEMRKEWLTNGMEERKRRRELGLPEIYLYGKNTTRITFNEFVNKELILFSNMDNERSIPSLVDGLKPGQRKVVYTCFKRNDKRDIKVAQLAGSVAEHSAYHHGENSLTMTIINLAQNFVGSNNINILLPIGQFGTRLQGGKDAASPRYIFTMLSPLARHLFSVLDTPLLKDLYDDNKKIEPEYYVPIIPMALVNGAEGIGTGWSTKVQNYNPRDLVKNILRLIDGQEPEEMMPWFKNFRGTIEKIEHQKYAVQGEIARLGDNKLEITELPIRVWTQSYKENVLEPMLHGSEKTPPMISDYKEYYTDTTVRFVITMTPEKYRQAENQGFHKVFKLQSILSTSTMVLFDKNGCLCRYETVEDILKEFFEVRMQLYVKRKEFLVGKLNAEALKLMNQARFIVEKIESKLVIDNKKIADVIKLFIQKKYDSDPVKAWKEALNADKEEDEDVSNSESDSEEKSKEKPQPGMDYDYLLDMTFKNATLEKKEELLKKRDQMRKELEDLKQKTPADLWRDDLNAFLKELDEVDRKEKEEADQPPKLAKGKGPTKKQMKTADETKPSAFAERIDPVIDAEMRKKVEKRPVGTEAGKRGRKKKGDVKEDEEEMDELLTTPLAERVESKIKAKKTKQAKVTTVNDKKSPTKGASPSKGGKKKKNPWSESESDNDISDLSDVEPAEDYIPPEKREVAPRRAAAKAKYTFESGDESEGSNVSLHDHDPEGRSEPKRYSSDEEEEFSSQAKEAPKKTAQKKPAAAKAVNGAQDSPVDSDSADSDIFPSKTEPKEAAGDNLFDSLLGGESAKSEASAKAPAAAASASAPKKIADSDSDSIDGFAAAKEVPKKRQPKKKKDSSDDDFAVEKKKPAAPKKPARKKVKKDISDDGDDPPKPKRQRKKKAAAGFSDDEFGVEVKKTKKAPPKKKKNYSSDGSDGAESDDKEDSMVIARPRATARARGPIKYNFGDDESSDD